jgi:hypothetical protein
MVAVVSMVQFAQGLVEVFGMEFQVFSRTTASMQTAKCFRAGLDLSLGVSGM